MAERRGETFVMREEAGPLTFSAVLLGVASTALIHLGVSPHPETGEKRVDLDTAREWIDVLELLREKTKGNLTSDEEKLLGSLLNDLRLRFVEHSTASRG
ncbi:MAG: hypothetical protein AMXMBFR34_45240 [Myxococcaceae bacterium]